MRLPCPVSLMGDFHFSVTNPKTLLLSLLFSLILLTLIRFVLFSFGNRSSASHSTDKFVANRITADPVQQQPKRSLRLSLAKWSWSREALPTFSPISITPPLVEDGNKPKGNEAPPMQAPDLNVRVKSAGPAFDHPLPAIYETEIPVSMAKMIMSRHTIRKPTTPRPPRRDPAPAVRRLQSMV